MPPRPRSRRLWRSLWQRSPNHTDRRQVQDIARVGSIASRSMKQDRLARSIRAHVGAALAPAGSRWCERAGRDEAGPFWLFPASDGPPTWDRRISSAPTWALRWPRRNRAIWMSWVRRTCGRSGSLLLVPRGGRRSGLHAARRIHGISIKSGRAADHYRPAYRSALGSWPGLVLAQQFVLAGDAPARDLVREIPGWPVTGARSVTCARRITRRLLRAAHRPRPAAHSPRPSSPGTVAEFECSRRGFRIDEQGRLARSSGSAAPSAPTWALRWRRTCRSNAALIGSIVNSHHACMPIDDWSPRQVEFT